LKIHVQRDLKYLLPSRLKEMSCQLSKQHELLRAIMQKMEIKAEADDKDDGMTLTTTVCPSTHL
jgi:hypothetical protein